MLQILKRKNLVYLAFYKCASTYYAELLAKNGWQHIKRQDIDWYNNTVFAFIAEPFERYIKGLAEDVYNNLTHWTVDNLPVFDNGVALTEHTWPIHHIVGENVNQVVWLKLSNNISRNNLLLETFLSEQNHKIVFYPVEEHRSNLPKLEVYNTIKKKVQRNDFLSHLISWDEIYFYSSRELNGSR